MRVELIHTALAQSDMREPRPPGPRSGCVIPGIGVFGALTPSLGLLAGVYRGFSPAAPPGGHRGTAVFTSAQPEHVNYEAGVRSRRRALRLEAIGFFNDYQNLTAICTIASCGPCTGGLAVRRRPGHIYGAEFFGRAEPTRRAAATRSLSSPPYTYTRSKLLEALAANSEDPTLKARRSGDELPFVPRHQASATLAFETPDASLAVAGTYVRRCGSTSDRQDSRRRRPSRSPIGRSFST